MCGINDVIAALEDAGQCIVHRLRKVDPLPDGGFVLHKGGCPESSNCQTANVLHLRFNAISPEFRACNIKEGIVNQ